MLIKFERAIKNRELLRVMLVLGLVTMFGAGVCAIVEEDVKKVVALRTLSQMGLSLVTVGVGLRNLAFIHLISHGFFKRLLFLQIGYLMHAMNSNQDPRKASNLATLHYYLQVQIKASLLTLCGQMFSNGMVTKEAIIGLYLSRRINLGLVVLFYVSILITLFYSYRL